MEKELVRQIFLSPGDASAYRIKNDQGYTLHLKTEDDDQCTADTWEFKIVKDPYYPATCPDHEEHKAKVKNPRLTLSTENFSMTYYQADQELQMGGQIDNLTMRICVRRPAGCPKCDVFWLRIDCYTCKGEHNFQYIPFKLVSQ